MIKKILVMFYIISINLLAANGNSLSLTNISLAKNLQSKTDAFNKIIKKPLLLRSEKKYELSIESFRDAEKKLINLYNDDGYNKHKKNIYNLLIECYKNIMEIYYDTHRFEEVYNLYKDILKIFPQLRNNRIYDITSGSLYMSGLKHYINNDLNKAAGLINEGEKIALVKHRNHAESSLSRMIKERIKLGNIKPRFTHRIGIFGIKHLNLNQVVSNGNLLKINNTLTSFDMENAIIMLSFVKLKMEVLTKGIVTFKIKSYFPDVTKTKANIIPHERRNNWYSAYIDEKFLTPYPSDVFFELQQENDVIVTIWNKNDFSSNGTGGTGRYTIIPDYFYSVQRGWMVLPSSWLYPGAINLVFHEYLHAIESWTGIQLTHLSKDQLKDLKIKYPGLTEKILEKEYDYFKWHIDNGGIKQAIIKDGTDTYWKNTLGYIRRRFIITGKKTFDYKYNAIKNISPEIIDQTKKLQEELDTAKKNNNRIETERILKEIVKINPAYYWAYKELADIAYHKDHQLCVYYLKKLIPFTNDIDHAMYLANVYEYKLKNKEESLKYYNLSLEYLYESIKLKESLDCYELALNDYRHAAYLFTNNQKYEISLKICNEALNYWQKHKLLKNKMYYEILYWKGETLFYTNDKSQGLKLMREAIDNELNNDNWYSNRYNRFRKIKENQLNKLGAKIVNVNSMDSEHPAENVIDGDPDTFWHTKWRPNVDPLPHNLIIDLGKELVLKGLTYLPRQDMANGRINEYEILIGKAKDNCNTSIYKGRFPNTNEEQRVIFTKSVKTRFIKILIKSEVQGNPFASIAELDVIVK